MPQLLKPLEANFKMLSEISVLPINAGNARKKAFFSIDVFLLELYYIKVLYNSLRIEIPSTQSNPSLNL